MGWPRASTSRKPAATPRQNGVEAVERRRALPGNENRDWRTGVAEIESRSTVRIEAATASAPRVSPSRSEARRDDGDVAQRQGTVGRDEDGCCRSLAWCIAKRRPRWRGCPGGRLQPHSPGCDARADFGGERIAEIAESSRSPSHRRIPRRRRRTLTWSIAPRQARGRRRNRPVAPSLGAPPLRPRTGNRPCGRRVAVPRRARACRRSRA